MCKQTRGRESLSRANCAPRSVPASEGRAAGRGPDHFFVAIRTASKSFRRSGYVCGRSAGAFAIIV